MWFFPTCETKACAAAAFGDEIECGFAAGTSDTVTTLAGTPSCQVIGFDKTAKLVRMIFFGNVAIKLLYFSFGDLFGTIGLWTGY
jgi:hypothetical protein